MSMNNRKGVELSMNMIIVTILVLLVLLIVAFLLIRGSGNWSKGTDCLIQGGKCAPSGQACGDGGYTDYPLPSALTCQKDEKCCTKISFGG